MTALLSRLRRRFRPSPSEAWAAAGNQIIADPGFHEAMAHAERVARRSFPTLYEDDEPSAT